MKKVDLAKFKIQLDSQRITGNPDSQRKYKCTGKSVWILLIASLKDCETSKLAMDTVAVFYIMVILSVFIIA